MPILNITVKQWGARRQNRARRGTVETAVCCVPVNAGLDSSVFRSQGAHFLSFIPAIDTAHIKLAPAGPEVESLATGFMEQLPQRAASTQPDRADEFLIGQQSAMSNHIRKMAIAVVQRSGAVQTINLLAILLDQSVGAGQ